MANIEFEHSFKVTDIKPFLDYCEQNGYKKESVVVQNRKVYENALDKKIIARITTETKNEETKTILDFKNVNSKNGDLNISSESIPLVIKDNDLDAIESILETINFIQAADNLRTRYVYSKNNIKFEIDEYIRPQAKVVAIEGDKFEVEKTYQTIKQLIDNNKE